MFSNLFKKKYEPTLQWLRTDMHSHLVPGVDDGAANVEESLELIKGLQELGYSKVIATPHVLWEMYPNTADIIDEKADEVRKALKNKEIDMEFSAAAEYYIDEQFVTALNNKDRLLTVSDNVLLVEFSMMNAPFDLKEVLFEVQMQGYTPLIAHPERYIYMKSNKDLYHELKEAGCEFQLNLLSITGFYGKSVQDLADYLLKNEMYSYAGTDMHNEKHLAALKNIFTSPLYPRLLAADLKNKLL